VLGREFTQTRAEGRLAVPQLGHDNPVREMLLPSAVQHTRGERRADRQPPPLEIGNELIASGKTDARALHSCAHILRLVQHPHVGIQQQAERVARVQP
jgi:hypothetical protein